MSRDLSVEVPYVVIPSARNHQPSARFQRTPIFSMLKSGQSDGMVSTQGFKNGFDFKLNTKVSSEGELSLFPPGYCVYPNNVFLAGMFSNSYLHKEEPGKSFTKASIVPFDYSKLSSRDDDFGGQEEGHLQKRKRGRPKKTMSGNKPMKKKTPEKDEELKEDNLIFMNENAHVFESDSEEQKLELQQEEVHQTFDLVFSASQGMTESNDSEERNRSYRLDIGKLIRAIESEQAKNKIKKFVCRFCGKAFDKPSSLGGHTAKTHNGLSLKYKNRLTAAKNRKTERNRIQFLKQSINQELNDSPTLKTT